VTEHPKAFVEMLQAAKRYGADRVMGARTARCPVIVRADFQVVPVGSEAGFDLPDLVIADNRIFAGQSCRALGIVDENGMQPVPFRRLPGSGFVDLYLNRVRERLKSGVSVVAEAGGLAVSLEASVAASQSPCHACAHPCGPGKASRSRCPSLRPFQ